MRMRYLIVAAIGLVVGLLLLALWRTPRVTSWLPDTDVIRAGQSITFETNTSLTTEDVWSHFQITPNISGDIRIEGRSVHFDPHKPLEYGQSYTITLSPSAWGNSILPSLNSYEKHYSVSEPKLLFMRGDGFSTSIWSQDETGAMAPLANEPRGIWDYSVLPDGEGVLVSSMNEDGSADLVRFLLSGERDLILDCGEDRCLDGHWQPNGILVAFQKSKDTTEVWLVDTESGTEMSLREFAFSNEDDFRQGPSSYPRWSADGRYLSFYMPDQQQLAILDMRNVDLWTIPVNVDLMGEWSPSGYQLAFTELVLNESHDDENLEDGGSIVPDSGTSFTSRLKVIDVESKEKVDLGGANINMGGVPEWSFDNTLIAVSRALDGNRQLWSIPLDGSDPEMITGDGSFTFSAPRSSPDGQHMAFMRSQALGSYLPPGIWLLDLDNGQKKLIVEEAYLPDWLP